MSQPRNLVIQSEPLGGAIVDLLRLAGRCDPDGRRTLDRLGVQMTASFSARGGVLFVGYLDGRAVAVGAFAPVGDGRVEIGAALTVTHRSTRSIRRAMLDYIEDVAHLQARRPPLRRDIEPGDFLPERWIGVVMGAHAALHA
jgi:hypothetical protein